MIKSTTISVLSFLFLLRISSSLSPGIIRSKFAFNFKDCNNQLTKSIIGGLASLSIMSFTTVAPAIADAIPTVGQSAPTFTLPSNAGKSISLQDLSGKWTVLYFYPGDFTQGCTIEAQSFERDIQKYKDLDVQIVGVSVDSVDKHLDFGKTYGLDFPLLSDKGGVVSNSYGSLLDLGFIGKFSNRQTYIISPDSKVKYVFTDVESSVAKHSENVLAKLKTLI